MCAEIGAVTHAGPATGAFGGAPYGATKRARGVPKWARSHMELIPSKSEVYITALAGRCHVRGCREFLGLLGSVTACYHTQTQTTPPLPWGCVLRGCRHGRAFLEVPAKGRPTEVRTITPVTGRGHCATVGTISDCREISRHRFLEDQTFPPARGRCPLRPKCFQITLANTLITA